MSVCLEQSELLLSGTEDLILLDLEDVESNSLRKWSALSASDNVTLLNIEAGRAVNSGVLVALLETVVLLDVMEVVATNNDGSGHLGRNNHSSEDSSTDGNITSERALLVNIGAGDGFLGGLETKADVLPPALRLLGSNTNGAGILSLESSLVLVSHYETNYGNL